MLNPEDEKVIAQVAAKLAGPPQPKNGKALPHGPFWWVEHDDLTQEAYALCLETDVLRKATSPGAFHERIKGKLIDSQKTERKWRDERIAPIELADVSENGTVFTYGEAGEHIAYKGQNGAWKGTNDEAAVAGREWKPNKGKAADGRARHVSGKRSRLLDKLGTMHEDDFLAWAEGQLTDTKMTDLTTLLYGSRQEQDILWKKYVSGKRVGGTTTAEDRETRIEEWRARYRWQTDSRSRRIRVHPLVISTDGTAVEVGAVLREPIR